MDSAVSSTPAAGDTSAKSSPESDTWELIDAALQSDYVDGIEKVGIPRNVETTTMEDHTTLTTPSVSKMSSPEDDLEDDFDESTWKLIDNALESDDNNASLSDADVERDVGTNMDLRNTNVPVIKDQANSSTPMISNTLQKSSPERNVEHVARQLVYEDGENSDEQGGSMKSFYNENDLISSTSSILLGSIEEEPENARKKASEKDLEEVSTDVCGIAKSNICTAMSASDNDDGVDHALTPNSSKESPRQQLRNERLSSNEDIDVASLDSAELQELDGLLDMHENGKDINEDRLYDLDLYDRWQNGEELDSQEMDDLVDFKQRRKEARLSRSDANESNFHTDDVSFQQSSIDRDDIEIEQSQNESDTKDAPQLSQENGDHIDESSLSSWELGMSTRPL